MSLASDKQQAVSSKQSRELLQQHKETARARARERARVRVRANFDECNKPHVYSMIFWIRAGQGSLAC